MFRNILLVFENEQILPEALVYVREFALRVDATVTLLMIVPMSFVGRTLIGPKRNTIRNIEIRAGKSLSECLQPFIQEGIDVNSALKIGDPGQELMKFLADRPPFQSIIWGSGRKLPHKGRGVGRHWISKVVDNLECPLLTVSKKETE
ncbi:MAG TPA: universal stress protein [Desulfobacteraceae bacterium]|nr:universal stress protein [Desulfobacteraceae bacterium]